VISDMDIVLEYDRQLLICFALIGRLNCI